MYFIYDVQLFGIPWTVAYQTPVSMKFFRQEYWSGWPFPSPGDLPNLGIKPGSPALKSDSLLSEPPGKPMMYIIYKQSPSMWVALSFSFFLIYFLIEAKLL